MDIAWVVEWLVRGEVDVLSIASRHFANLRWPWCGLNLGCMIDYWGFWHDEDMVVIRVLAKINVILTRREQISWPLDSNGLGS